MLTLEALRHDKKAAVLVIAHLHGARSAKTSEPA